eukprot:Rhum_TRINITY_DN14835_c30_g1::Rhum_TRINITY_DN14835_c30_g1_i1::g.123261::m.123261
MGVETTQRGFACVREKGGVWFSHPPLPTHTHFCFTLAPMFVPPSSARTGFAALSNNNKRKIDCFFFSLSFSLLHPLFLSPPTSASAAGASAAAIVSRRPFTRAAPAAFHFSMRPRSSLLGTRRDLHTSRRLSSGHRASSDASRHPCQQARQSVCPSWHWCGSSSVSKHTGHTYSSGISCTSPHTALTHRSPRRHAAAPAPTASPHTASPLPPHRSGRLSLLLAALLALQQGGDGFGESGGVAGTSAAPPPSPSLSPSPPLPSAATTAGGVCRWSVKRVRAAAYNASKWRSSAAAATRRLRTSSSPSCRRRRSSTMPRGPGARRAHTARQSEQRCSRRRGATATGGPTCS